jgi:putative addiction module component (TIGR02574 family)
MVIRSELETEVLALPEEDRVRLVELLWESLTPRDVQARAERWAAESERRLDAVQAGQLPSIDAAKVFQELRESPRR